MINDIIFQTNKILDELEKDDFSDSSNGLYDQITTRLNSILDTQNEISKKLDEIEANLVLEVQK